MSACYAICLKVKITDEPGIVKSLNEKIKHGPEEHTKYPVKELGADTSTFDGLMKVFLAGWDENDFRKYEENGFLVFSNGFNASYGWESVMMDMFDLMAPFLADGSEFDIDIENDNDHGKVRNNKVIWK